MHILRGWVRWYEDCLSSSQRGVSLRGFNKIETGIGGLFCDCASSYIRSLIPVCWVLFVILGRKQWDLFFAALRLHRE